jgi:hypothetical protein
MDPDQTRPSAPLEVSLELHPFLRPFLDDSDLHDALRDEVRARLDELCATLGVPARASVRLAELERHGDEPEPVLRIAIGGTMRIPSDETVTRVEALWRRSQPGPFAGHHQAAARIGALVGADPPSEPARRRALTLVGAICGEIAAERPGLLMGAQQATTYLEGLLPVEGPDGLMDALASVVDLGISIADRSRCGQILHAALAARLAAYECAEELVTGLVGETVELHVAERYLEELSRQDLPALSLALQQLRENVLLDLGLRIPPIELVPSGELPPRCFALKVNELLQTPWVGLRRPAQEAIDYVIVCINADLRRRLRCFVHQALVDRALGDLERRAPGVVAGAKDTASMATLTRVIRSLLAESVPVSDLTRILEAVMDCDVIVVDPIKDVMIDERVPVSRIPNEEHRSELLTAFARTRLKRLLSYLCTEGLSVLRVHVLDRDTEQVFLKELAPPWRSVTQPWKERYRADLLAAMRAATSDASADGAPAAVLTIAEVRPVVRDLLDPEFSQYPVVAYRDLLPGVELRPMGVLSLPR